jgi:chromatin remodeling complex protein RSC6
MINADEKLRKVFGKEQVSMFEMTKNSQSTFKISLVKLPRILGLSLRRSLLFREG